MDRRNEITNDDHDDTPLILMLIHFVKNPILASYVQELSHRCHQHLPDPWEDVASGMAYNNSTFSMHPNTKGLIRRAIKNMTNVTTVRLILGHQTIVKELLQGFFGHHRQQPCHVKRLWVESCSLSNLVGTSFSGPGLETIRCRRMRIGIHDLKSADEGGFFALARRTTTVYKDGTYDYTIDRSASRPPDESPQACYELEASIYRNLPEDLPGDLRICASSGSAESKDKHTEHFPADLSGSAASAALEDLLSASSSTLTSLTLDWVIDQTATVRAIAGLTFPHLKAFQVRNAVLDDAQLPQMIDWYLFSPLWLAFLNRHPKIQCLAWPMQHFLPDNRAITSRECSIVSQVCQGLKQIRIDSPIIHTNSDAADILTPYAWTKLKEFVTKVAPFLTSLQSIKIEGSIPYQITDALFRALHASPLCKVVIIGLLFPVKFFWGNLHQRHRKDLYLNQFDVQEQLKWDIIATDSPETQSDEVQTLSMREQRQPPFLLMLAQSQAPTITQLKFCGFYGAPILQQPSPSMQEDFSFLSNYHRLTHLTSAFWILTYYKGRSRSDQIRSLWEGRHKGDTAAVAAIYEEALASFPEEDAELDNVSQWAEALRHYWEPAQLAIRIAELIGPHLSAYALARNNGIMVKGLFLLREANTNHLFDMDVKIGVDRKVHRYLGPRGENDPQRLKEKLETRDWF